MKKSKRKVILGFLLVIILTVAGGVISYQGIGKSTREAPKILIWVLTLQEGLVLPMKFREKDFSEGHGRYDL